MGASIYFTGGSYADAEYIWMKDYLQLEGLVYKLVPKDPLIPNPYLMGRVDSDLMYDIVQEWNGVMPTVRISIMIPKPEKTASLTEAIWRV